MFLEQTRPVYNYTKYQSNRSRLQRASNMTSTELSASLLRRGPKMYPAALKWRSIAADAAGMQVTEQRN